MPSPVGNPARASPPLYHPAMRLFVGIPAGRLASALAPFLETCRERAPFCRWLPAESLHLTVRFLGEVAPENRPELERWFEEAAANAPAPRLALSRTGLFRKRERVVLHIHLAQDETLERLTRRLLTPVIGLEPENRQFVPHLTLARAALSPAENIRFREFLAWFGSAPLPRDVETPTGITLFESALTPAGAVHTPLVTLPFRPSA